MRSPWPAVLASSAAHVAIVLLATLFRPPPDRTLLRPQTTVDLELSAPPEAPPPPAPVVPPPPVPPPVPTNTPPPPAHVAAAAAVRPAQAVQLATTVLTAPTPGGGDTYAQPSEPAVPRDAGVPAVPSNLHAASLLTGAHSMSLALAGLQPTPEEVRQEIRQRALEPIIAGLHANDHIDPAGTARASAVLTTRIAEEIATRLSAPALVPEVARAPSIDLPAFHPTESAGERMAASELDAIHANAFQSVPMAPGRPACSSYRALLVDVAITDSDGGRANVAVVRGSGVSSLDRSVLEVAREVAVEASPPGSTRWRFELADDASSCGHVGGWRPIGSGNLRVRFRRLHGGGS